MTSWDTGELQRFIDDLEAAPARVVRGVGLVMDRTGSGSVTAMRGLARVDTGAMRDSTGYDVHADGLGFEAGPTVAHAPFNEYGTSRMSPQPFVIPGFESQLPAAYEGFADALADGLLGP